MTTPQQLPENFTQEELEQSLSEQSFGISSYEIISVSEREASAHIVLLEGNTITVSLTPRGYELVPTSPIKSKEENIFEDIIQLLHFVSKEYEDARRRLLMDRVALLAESSPEVGRYR